MIRLEGFTTRSEGKLKYQTTLRIGTFCVDFFTPERSLGESEDKLLDV
jgi:hypothetical protein